MAEADRAALGSFIGPVTPIIRGREGSGPGGPAEHAKGQSARGANMVHKSVNLRTRKRKFPVYGAFQGTDAAIVFSMNDELSFVSLILPGFSGV